LLIVVEIAPLNAVWPASDALNDVNTEELKFVIVVSNEELKLFIVVEIAHLIQFDLLHLHLLLSQLKNLSL